jgi:flagellin-specific chaperone FliS
MKTHNQIREAMVKTIDPTELRMLLQEALDVIAFEQAQNAFVTVRVKKLIEQVERQTAMIENLEKTLWSKK